MEMNKKNGFEKQASERCTYMKPMIEIVDTKIEHFMANPTSWVDGYGGRFKIYEEDPDYNGDDDYGKGAKAFNSWGEDWNEGWDYQTDNMK